MLSNFGEYIKNSIIEVGLLNNYNDFTGDLEISEDDFNNKEIFNKIMYLVNKGRIEIEDASYIWVLSREEDIYMLSFVNYDSTFLER